MLKRVAIAAVALIGYAFAQATLPQNWVNALEYRNATTYTVNFPTTWSCNGTNYPTGGGNYASTTAGLQQAVNDAETCRKNTANSTTIIIPHGTLFSAAAGLVLPQTATDTASTFIVLTSDTPLPVGQTACSHGIQDNLATSLQPGIRNVGCNGALLSYQLGTTITPINYSLSTLVSTGATPFTLANGVLTNTSAYNDIASMWTLECTAANCNSLSTGVADVNGVGPHHYAILNAEIRLQAGNASTTDPISIGQGTETATGAIPAHIHLAYVYVHGDITDAPVSAGVATGPPTGSNTVVQDIFWAACLSCSFTYSYIDKSLRPGGEGHTLGVHLGQTLKLVHNWFEGQSSGMFCGGWSTPIPINGFVTCQDVEDRANRYTYPYSWILANAAGFCVNGLACSGHGYVRKNGHESKMSLRYLFDGNIVENVDNTGGQVGILISWKTSNTSTGLGDNYWAVLTDTTVTNNIFRNACNGPNWGFRSLIQSSNGGGTAFGPTRGLWSNNLLYNVTPLNPGCAGSTPGYGFRFSSGGPGNTWSATATRDATGTIATLTLTSQSGGKQSTEQVGDPVQVTCSDNASFNTTSTVMGPLAITGTLPTGLTIVYPNVGLANDAATTCTFNDIQGYATNFTYTHNSNFLTDASYLNDPYSGANGGSVPYLLARSVSFTNSIFGGGINSAFSEGTRTTTKAYDPASIVLNNDIFPARDTLVTCTGHGSQGAGGFAACYTEYSNSSVAINPPVSLYGVPTNYCTGNDPTVGSCVGVLGAMSVSSLPAVLNDWHQYRLCHSTDAACNNKASLYAAGQTHQASDGTDLGFNPSPIDAAMTSTWYQCACSGNGPWPDVFNAPVSKLVVTAIQ
jgi:hypothetical protein